MANAAAVEAIADVAALIAARLQAAEIENPRYQPCSATRR